VAEPSLMWVKVLGLAAAGIAFVWWQLRDVARAQSRAAARRSDANAPEREDSTAGPALGEQPPTRPPR
jgi:hypothetical protein